MSNLLEVLISIVVVSALVVVISQRFRISKRYERKSHSQNPWSALDNGIDPTDDGGKK
jgi:type II secretory pathway pseudopilin PulG